MKNIIIATVVLVAAACPVFGVECRFKRVLFDENGDPKAVECLFRILKTDENKVLPSPVIVTKTHILHVRGAAAGQPRNLSKDPKYFEFLEVIKVSDMEAELGELRNVEWKINIDSDSRSPRGSYINVGEIGGNLIGFALGAIDDDPKIKSHFSGNGSK